MKTDALKQTIGNKVTKLLPNYTKFIVECRHEDGFVFNRIIDMIPGATALANLMGQSPLAEAEAILQYPNDEYILVPRGTQVLQFIMDKSAEEIPIAAILVCGNSIFNGVVSGHNAYYSIFSWEEQENIKEKIAIQNSVLFKEFIPSKYYQHSGITVKNISSHQRHPEQKPVLSLNLFRAMKQNQPDSIGRKWNWDHAKNPVMFTQGEPLSPDGFNSLIIWFYHSTTKQWLGWNCEHRTNISGLCIMGDPNVASYSENAPKDYVDLLIEPVFMGVSLTDFITYVGRIFSPNKPNQEQYPKTPQELAEKMAETPYGRDPQHHSLYAIPTPINKWRGQWAWVYEVVELYGEEHRYQLIWLPSNIVFTRGLQCLPNHYETNPPPPLLGKAVELTEPKWLNASIELGIILNRSCDLDPPNNPENPPNNSGFFKAIESIPSLGAYHNGAIQFVEPNKLPDCDTSKPVYWLQNRDNNLSKALSILQEVT